MLEPKYTTHDLNCLNNLSSLSAQWQSSTIVPFFYDPCSGFRDIPKLELGGFLRLQAVGPSILCGCGVRHAFVRRIRICWIEALKYSLIFTQIIPLRRSPDSLVGSSHWYAQLHSPITTYVLPPLVPRHLQDCMHTCRSRSQTLDSDRGFSRTTSSSWVPKVQDH